MRNPERIDEITAKLNEIWHKYPDMRFWQLLLNISWGFKGDAFFMEDDKVIAALEKVDKEGL